MRMLSFSLISALVLLSTVGISSAQNTSCPPVGFSSTDPTIREAAFYATSNCPDTTEFRAALISLLAMENSYGQSQSDLSEDYVTYHGDLTLSVAQLGDLRSVSALADVVDTGSMAMNALAGFGSQALDALTSRINSNDVTVRNAVVLTAGLMLQPPFEQGVNDSLSRAKLREIFMQAASDPNLTVSRNAQEGASLLSSTQTTPYDDLNGDGLVDCSDANLLAASFGKSFGDVGFDPRADVNGDRLVNLEDVILVLEHDTIQGDLGLLGCLLR